MNFRTEAEVKVQTTRDEDTYMKQLFEAICNVFPEEIRVGKFFDIKYLPEKRKNQIEVSWRGEESDIPKLTNMLKKHKWFRKHNIFNIYTIY